MEEALLALATAGAAAVRERGLAARFRGAFERAGDLVRRPVLVDPPASAPRALAAGLAVLVLEPLRGASTRPVASSRLPPLIFDRLFIPVTLRAFQKEIKTEKDPPEELPNSNRLTTFWHRGDTKE